MEKRVNIIDWHLSKAQTLLYVCGIYLPQPLTNSSCGSALLLHISITHEARIVAFKQRFLEKLNLSLTFLKGLLQL